MANGGKRYDPKSPSRASSHELRRSIMEVLVGRKDGAPVSSLAISEELGKPFSEVNYHVRVLAECEAIERVATRPIGRTVQHFYWPSPGRARL
jgi:predicted ArsR family transcriptional regulator